jgi:hypothetical protein
MSNISELINKPTIDTDWLNFLKFCKLWYKKNYIVLIFKALSIIKNIISRCIDNPTRYRWLAIEEEISRIGELFRL